MCNTNKLQSLLKRTYNGKLTKVHRARHRCIIWSCGRQRSPSGRWGFWRLEWPVSGQGAVWAQQKSPRCRQGGEGWRAAPRMEGKARGAGEGLPVPAQSPGLGRECRGCQEWPRGDSGPGPALRGRGAQRSWKAGLRGRKQQCARWKMKELWLNQMERQTGPMEGSLARSQRKRCFLWQRDGDTADSLFVSVLAWIGLAFPYCCFCLDPRKSSFYPVCKYAVYHRIFCDVCDDVWFYVCVSLFPMGNESADQLL